MDMPTPCPECGDVVELDTMSDLGNELYCTECAYELGKSDEK